MDSHEQDKYQDKDDEEDEEMQIVKQVFIMTATVESAKFMDHLKDLNMKDIQREIQLDEEYIKLMSAF